MKKLLGIVVLGLLWFNISFAAEYDGKGELKLSNHAVKYFMIYIRGTTNTPGTFYVTEDGRDVYYWTCPYGQCQPAKKAFEAKKCSIAYGRECKLFAQRRTVKWKNGINSGKGKASRFSLKMSDAEVRAKLTQLGFLGETKSSTKKITKKETSKKAKTEIEKLTDLYNSGALTKDEFEKAKAKINNGKKKKQKTKKTAKKYTASGSRSVALSWEGYENLIAGTVKFEEADYKGTLSLPLPNNDGTCDGTYSLQEGGKGTWQIACTNNMGAAGTLKWTKDGAVTGTGRDHNDKKVKFTVSKKS